MWRKRFSTIEALNETKRSIADLSVLVFYPVLLIKLKKICSAFAQLPVLLSSGVRRVGVVGNNHPRINLRTRTLSCSLLFTQISPSVAAASARSSISSSLLWQNQGDGGRSNTRGPRCLNSQPQALISAYQSETDNPWQSFLVNQEQIEAR